MSKQRLRGTKFVFAAMSDQGKMFFEVEDVEDSRLELDFSNLSRHAIANIRFILVTVGTKLDDDLDTYINNWDSNPINQIYPHIPEKDLQEILIQVAVGSTMGYLNRLHEGLMDVVSATKEG